MKMKWGKNETEGSSRSMQTHDPAAAQQQPPPPPHDTIGTRLFTTQMNYQLRTSA